MSIEHKAASVGKPEKKTRLYLLSDKDCQRLRAGKSNKKQLNDGGGLFLLQRDDGRTFWRYRFEHLGKGKLAGFGEYTGNAGGVGLAYAREKADAYRAAVRANVNPTEQKRERRRKEQARTPEAMATRKLEAFATKYHADISQHFKNRKHREQWLSSLQPVFDQLGDRDLAEITKQDLIDVLKPLFKSAPETARRVRQRIMAVFKHASWKDAFEKNPAIDLDAKSAKIELGEPPMKKAQQKHLAALAF
jgi:hypothetical protein